MYTHLTPKIAFTASPIVKLGGSSLSGTRTSVAASRLQLELANGDTWLLYASADATADVSASSVTFTSKYDGVVRLALSPSADASSVLDEHAGRVPTGGSVQAVVNGDVATLSFNWRSEGDGPLLLMALPHHLDVLDGVTRTKVTHNTLKGDMERN